MFKKIFVTMTVLLFCASMAIARDQVRQKGQKKDQKRDGSCEMIHMDDGQSQKLAQQNRNRNQKRNQKRNGDCQTSLTHDISNHLMTADQTRTRNPQHDRKKDGSCQS
jgi:hypothetical protein